MQKLKSLKNFESEILESEKMLNVLGGTGGPASSPLSSNYVVENTKNPLDNCTDQSGRVDSDFNGTTVRGESTTICQETQTTPPCYP